MFYLFVYDYFITLGVSMLLSFAFFDSIDYFYFLWPMLLLITSFLREHEAKVKGRLKAVERTEFLKYYDDYDNYVFVKSYKSIGDDDDNDNNIEPL